MHEHDTTKVRELFWAASDLDSVEAQERYIEQAAVTDAVRDEVRALLEHRRPSDRPRTGALFGPALGTAQPVTAGMSVEGFRLLRVIGTGGSGVVYEAEQDHPKRRVALKLLRPEYISETATRRLSFEADVLGSLRHVGIAQVHAAGVHDDPTGDRPYFAMELIPDAKPITDYADDEYLALEDRLRLMAAVCDAAQYAHRRGVVHRDLKPSNMLVDSEGQAKIIDFGIAQSEDRSGLTNTLHTRTGDILGTVAYMSPEQAAGRSVDTRSDVYALGVVLYELVTGRLPYDFDQRTPYEALRLIQESPPRPPRSLSPNLPADIESIILKALDHDPGHRYQSAGEFSEDIKRFLHHEPVAARPPSAWRRVRLWSVRHPATTTGAAAGLSMLLVGLVFIVWFAIQEATARNTAEKKASQLTDVTAFMVDEMLGAASPSTPLTLDSTLSEMLARTDEKIDTIEDPEIRAIVLTSLGEIYNALSDRTRALELLEEAVALRDELGNHAEHPQTLLVTGNCLAKLDEKARGRDVLTRLLTILKDRGIDRSPAGIAARIELAEVQVYIDGGMQSATARLEEAGRLIDALGLQHDQLAVDFHLCVATLETLRENGAGMLRSYEAAYAIADALEPRDELQCAHIRYQIGDAYRILRQHDKAEPLMREALARYGQLVGDNHTHVGQCLAGLANIAADRGRFAEARELALSSAAIYRAQPTVSKAKLAAVLMTVGWAEMGLGRYEDAAAMHEEALALRRAVESPAPPRIANPASQLAGAYIELNRLEEAEVLLLEAWELAGNVTVLRKRTLERLILLYERWDRPDDAEIWRRRLEEMAPPP